jgi:hypothetical protein
MAIYRFVGDVADIYNPPYNFRRFGQKADIDDALAQLVVGRGVPLIPEAEFEAIGFADAELAKYPSAISHMSAPDDFKRRKKTALIALDEYRRALKAPGTSQPATSPSSHTTDAAQE